MIRSTFYGFGTALSGMSSAQMALDVVGNNMSNVNTTGYTRQRLDLNSVPSSTYADRYASKSPPAIGQGVNVAGVSQIRDPFLDARFRKATSSVGELDAYLSSINDIASTFDEVQNDALKAALADFRSQLQVYTSAPNNVEIESTVRAAADKVLRFFNQYANELSTIREEQTQLLEDITIPKVNKILENISVLNKSIREAELYGNPALELKDQRNLLIDELSAYIKIDVSYEKDAQHPHIDNLRITFLGDDTDPTTNPLDTKERTLVFGKEYATLSAETTYDANGIPTTSVTSSNVLTAPPGNALAFQSGAIKGALDMLNERGEFSDSSIKGIGFYEDILDQVVRDFAEQFNNANKKINPDYDDTLPIDPITNPQYLAEDILFTTGDGSGTITAKNIAIHDDWANGSYGITYTQVTSPDGGTIDVSGATDNLLYMISLLEKKFSFTTEGIGAGATSPTAKPLYTGSFEEMFANIGTIAALEAESKTSALETYTYSVQSIEELRNSISSVSMDEEGVDLLRFQKAYSAAARVMTTLDEALEVLINKTGVVGR